MKKLFNYKHTLKCFFVLMVMLTAYTSNASHLAGGEITYKCIGLRKWEVTLVVYRDCNGIPMPNCTSGSQTGCTKTLTVKPMATIAGGGLNPNGCTAPVPSISVVVTSFKIVRIMQDAQSVCGTGAKNQCNNNGTSTGGSYSPALEAFHYKGVLDMSSPAFAAANVCPYWEVVWEEPARSGGIINIPSTNFHVRSVINIKYNQSNGNCKNNSPEFKNEAVMVVCSGVPLSINAGASDPDGDSLTYRITKAKATGGNDITYITPYSEYRPFPLNGSLLPHTQYPQPSGPYVILDSANGTISFNGANVHPTNFIIGTLNIEAWQWFYDQNGLPYVVGITQRDLQFYLKSCPANQVPVFATNPSLPNGTPKYNWTVCAGEEICFTITANDSDDGPGINLSTKLDTTYIRWDNAIVRPGKLTFAKDYDSTNPALRPREERWRFCWQTELSDGSNLPYYFTATAMDNSCPNIGHITKAFSITVVPRPTLSDSIYQDGCGKFRYEVKKLNLKQSFASARLDIAKNPNDFTFAGGSHVTLSSNPNPTGTLPTVILLDTAQFTQPGKYLVKYQVTPTVGTCPALIVYDTITVYTVGMPPVTLTAQQDTVCKNVATLVLTASPVGGKFSGTAVDSNGVINISSSSIFVNNHYAYKYKYVDSANTCADSVTKTIFVRPNIVAAITALDTVCKNVTTLKLTGSPVGGVFSGIATDTNGTINIQHPDVIINAGYSFKYKYSNKYGCLDSTTKNIYVKPNVQTTLTAALDTVCKNVTSLTLVGTPVGGVFSGIAVNAAGNINIQNTGITVNNNHAYKYKYSNAFGCADSSVKTIYVRPNIQTILTTPLDTVCKNVTSLTLVGTPVGGVYSGTAIDNNGNINLQNNTITVNTKHTFKYKLSNSFGCVDSTTKAVFVKPNIQAVLTAPLDTVCKNVTSFTLTGIPASGMFTGTAINNTGKINLQDVNITSNTSHLFKYKYSNAFGCVDSTTRAVFVKPNVQATLTAALDTVCKSANSLLLTGTPAGGVFSGTSINANGSIYLQNPFIIPNTTYTYTYTFGNNFGCRDTAYKTIFVVPAIGTPTAINGNAQPFQNQVYEYTTDSFAHTTYNWMVTGGTLQSYVLNKATVLWTNIGVATINVTLGNRCDTNSLNKVVQVSQGSGINESSWLNDFTLFPNPATNQITVSFYAKQTDMNLQVFNSTLQLVKTVPLTATNNQYNTTVSLDNLSAGLYFVKVGNSQYQHTTKVIVNK